MRTESVEIYSDSPNQAILRHPGRQFPGVLVQGDTLKMLHGNVVAALNCDGGALSQDARVNLEHVREVLGECLDHYRAVLRDHAIDLPFVK